jgi:uncharacterized protein with GYD domain
MPIYIDLLKLTDQGAKNIKNAFSESRMKDNFKVAESFGGKVRESYTVMGEYDSIAITEFPSDEASKASSLRLCSNGDYRMTTLRAFTQAELAEIVKKLS